jgi:hypothetical protein
MNFPVIFVILSDFLLDIEAQDQHRSSPPQHHHATSCPPRTASHWVKGPHRLRLPERSFHRTHEVLQHVQFPSEVPSAPPFDNITFCLACVDLDHHISSAAQAPTTSEIYLEHCRRRKCSNLVQFGAFDAPQHDFI